MAESCWRCDCAGCVSCLTYDESVDDDLLHVPRSLVRRRRRLMETFRVVDEDGDFLRRAIDREPYPTAEAYALACHGRDEWRRIYLEAIVNRHAVIERLHTERDDDVRAVARLKSADTIDFTEESLTEWFAASKALYDRFADRIAVLEQRDATPTPTTKDGS